MGFEDPGGRQFVEVPFADGRPLKPGTFLGNMGEIHVAVRGELIEDHLQPSGAGTWIGNDENVIWSGGVIQIHEPNIVDGYVQSEGRPLHQPKEPT